MFSKFDSTKKGGLYWMDMWTMIKQNRNVFDFTGWVATFLEWGALWLIAADEDVSISPQPPSPSERCLLSCNLNAGPLADSPTIHAMLS